MKSLPIRIAVIIAAIAAGVLLGLAQIQPPRAAEDSPAFRRMMGNIRRLAAEAHPSGSAEIETVRTTLLAEIEGMGLTPVVEDAIGTTMNGETLRLQNIWVRLDAPDTERCVLFVSHYDSTWNGPGAADDMAAVCSMLEAMREGSQNSGLQTDLAFLFTDGEEEGMLGAFAFVQAHPELNGEIELVVNLEARGNRGCLLLFETSPKAYGLVKTVVQSGAKPVGTSWAAAVYAMMPNNTDLTVFLDNGYAGINFAAVEGVETYHMPTDSFENLNRDTAWQYLQTTLSLARYAGNNRLGGPAPRDSVYFPFLPGVLVLYPDFWSVILCCLSCAAALAYGVYEARNRRLKASFGSVLMALLMVLSVGSLVFFPSGSYLFYLPLLATALTAFFR
ncbi:MAG: M28 family peptidase, partial [Oscillospiraceae bacterium]|nr:M28 family peptidase [Oscillospiraceae bacterium]